MIAKSGLRINEKLMNGKALRILNDEQNAHSEEARFAGPEGSLNGAGS